jgi:vitamin B12 transporter
LGYCEPAFSGVDLEPIVISKNKTHLSREYSLDSSELKESPSDSPVEALGALPLDLQSRSPKSGIQTDFSLRGSTFQGVLMLMDGQRVNDPQTAHHNSDIPLTAEDIKRIDVLPGVGASVFGPDAIGGAVNIILKKPQTKKIVLELGGGEHKSGSGLFSITDKINNLGVRLSLENRESKGFRYDTDYKKFTSALSACVDVPDGDFNANFGYQEKEFGAFDFYTPGSNYPSKEWTKTYLLGTGFNLDKGGLIIKPNFSWRRHYDKFMLDKTQLRSNYLNHHRTDTFTPNIYFQKEAGVLGRLGAGFEYGEEMISSTNLGKHTRAHKSIFMDDSKDLSARLSLGLSFRSDDFEGFDRAYTGSMNLRYNLFDENYLRLGTSRSIRVPSFTELYYSDPTTLGNSALSAEKSINYQAGYDYKKGRLSFGSTLFFRKEEDFIDWVKLTSSQAQWQVENVTDDSVCGIENYMKLEISPNVTLGSNYTYINKLVDERGYIYKYGPNYAKHVLNNTLSINTPFGPQSIILSYKKKPGRRGWFLLNTRLNYNLNKFSSLFAEASNLFNVEYQEIEGIAQPGRWIDGGVRFEW